MQLQPWRHCFRRGGLVHLSCPSLPRFACGTALTESTPPSWWLKGRPRNVFRSRAEVELLSQLAVLLMPSEPIVEAFRDFPVKRCKEWGCSSLCPDFAAHGVLKVADAALFIEYDGYYRHLEPPGLARDMRKTRALLRFAPAGSVVLRIAHKERKWKDDSLQVLVDCWQSENVPALRRTLQQVADSMLQHCRDELVSGLVSQLEACAPAKLNEHARTFAAGAGLVGTASRSNRLEVQGFLQEEMRLTTGQVAKMIARNPAVLGYSIDANLKPTVEWIKGLGLSQAQVTKMIAAFPAVLGCSIDANLKPTVEWIKGLGLSQAQVAKMIAAFPAPTVEWITGLGLSQAQVAKMIAKNPAVLGYSIDANLKPTVEWIKGLGLSQAQVTKMIAAFPAVLGCSIDANLKPTVEWIKGLGLSQAQVAKMIAAFPAVLGCSIDANLKPTVEWIKGLGLSQEQVAKMIAVCPAVLGYSIDANLKPTVEWITGLGLSQARVAKMIARNPPLLGLSIDANLKPTVEWLTGLGLSQAQVAKMIAKNPAPTVEWIKGLGLSQAQVTKMIAAFPAMLGCSIDANLKPTVEWIKGLGLSQAQVAKMISSFPQVLGLSIAANLALKFALLQQFFARAAAAELVARTPRLWGYRHTRLEHRLDVLKSQGQLCKLAGAMTLGLDAFNRRFPSSRLPTQLKTAWLRQDVKALGVLSADVRSELQFELCQPYLMRNGFYRVCQHVEPSVLKSIMVECINFTFYRAGEAAFEAGQTAKSAFFIERGTLEYQQNRKTSKVKRKLRVGAHNEIIIAEAALWTFWDYVGTLTAPNPASMLKLDVEKHTKIISESELMGEFAAELALHFRPVAWSLAGLGC
ncbi:MTERF2 [Symbiodinium sp. CCMP2592]|nr:MTERF2 [Symbiodinium sp. CCMP2592]